MHMFPCALTFDRVWASKKKNVQCYGAISSICLLLIIRLSDILDVYITYIQIKINNIYLCSIWYI